MFSAKAASIRARSSRTKNLKEPIRKGGEKGGKAAKGRRKKSNS
jgi:hypothetical protein